MMIRSQTILASLLLCSATCVLSASTFTNGSFEINNSCNPDPGNFSTLTVGSTCMTGWTVTAGDINYINGYWAAADGTHSLDMIGQASAGAIEQTFDTTPGMDYSVSFSLAGNPDGQGPAIKSVLVSAAGLSQDYAFDATGKSSGNMGWVSRTFSFTAIDASTTLTFTSTTDVSNNNCCSSAALDNVSVSTPEPASAGFVVLGAMLIAASRLRRTRKPVASPLQ